ncbi:MAG: acyltransferase domain-containing protein, partial [Nocardioides sp.]|nr:acyltransferase domain-containing protein [Nocardioides sp.]
RTEPADDAIAVVGLAGVFPGAASARALWDNVVAGVDAITDVPEGRWDPVFFDPDAKSADRFPVRRGGFVDDVATFDPLAFGIMPVAAEAAEPDQLLALGAAAAALEDAGRPHERVDPRRAGVILGRGGYVGDGVARLDQRVRTAQQVVEVLRSVLPGVSEEHLQRVKEEFQDALGPEQPEGSIGLVPNLAASRIANRFDFRGPAWTVDAACASSLIAVDQAAAALRRGPLDLALAGGVHHCHDLTLWSVFSQLRALSPSGGIRPFSQAADGILVGEGTGLLALRRLSDALADGDRVYAVIHGSGVSSDGRAATLMSPESRGQVLGVVAAWRASGLDPADVGLVEAHGTATPLGDRTELATLRTVFGAPGAGPRAGLGSIKSMIGHAMPAAGAAGLIKTALAIHHGVLPPTLHVEDPHPGVDATRFRLVERTEPWEGRGPRLAGVNAFGFGGINAHVVLGEAPGARVGAVDPVPVGIVRDTAVVSSAENRPSRPKLASHPVEPVLLLAGADAADLLSQLDAQDALGDAALAPQALRTRPVPTGGPARLAVVAPDARRLALARKVLTRGTPFRGRNDVWFDPEGVLREGSVAFLYPGVEPEFAPQVEDVAAAFDLPLGDLASLGPDPSLQEKGRGILELGRLLTAALERLGVRPDEIAGHSMGEWTGLLVSGIAPEADVDRFLADLRPGEMEFPDVVFVALGSGAETAAEIVAGLPDAHVSHDNCPHQSVVCAPEAVLPAILERAAERRVMAVEMPFRSGFHSPLFAPYAQRMIDLFAEVQFTTAHTRLWSATSLAPYPDDPAALAALSGRHLVEQVRFRALVERLHAEGVRGFVQVGTGSLGGFLDDTLRGHDVVVVSAHGTGPAGAKHTGLGGLLRTAVALWSAGREVDLTPLLADRALLRTPDAPTGHVSAPSEPRPGTSPRPLRLGSRLVRGLTPLPLAAGTPTPTPHVDTPWREDFLASVTEAGAAVEQVLAAARHPRTPPPATRPAARRAATPTPAPKTAAPAPAPKPDAAPT